MELDIWQGDWGLPSLDLTCLQVMAYSKFSNAPLEFKKTNWPLSSYGRLPIFRHGKKVTRATYDSIVSYLQLQNYNADSKLDPKQCSDIIAYTALLRDKLFPALLYIWWVDEKNYTKLSRPWYSKVLSFPLNYFLPGHQQRAAKATINSFWSNDLIPEDQKETLIYKNAQECLNLLSHRLGNQKYFFGKEPCSLDAIVFGYLAPLLKAPFQNAALKNHLKGCPNLTAHVENILQTYFPLTPKEQEELKLKEELAAEEKREFPNKWRDITLCGLFALVAMMSYALLTLKINYPFLSTEDIDYPLEVQSETSRNEKHNHHNRRSYR